MSGKRCAAMLLEGAFEFGGGGGEEKVALQKAPCSPRDAALSTGALWHELLGHHKHHFG